MNSNLFWSFLIQKQVYKISMNLWFALDQWQNEQMEDAGKLKWYFK